MKHPTAPLFQHAYRAALARTLATSIALNNAVTPAERERLMGENGRADVVMQAACRAYYVAVGLWAA